MHRLSDLRASWTGSEEDRLRLRKAAEAGRKRRGGHGEWGRFCEECGEDALAITEYQLALRDDASDTTALSRLALLLPERGDAAQALRCAERWLAAEPRDPAALCALVELYLDAELPERAAEALAQARRSGMDDSHISQLEARVKGQARVPEEEPTPDAGPASALRDSDIVRFNHLFAGRENVYARQWADPSGDCGYAPVREPFTFAVARNHLLGSITAGIYPVRLDNTVNFCAIDIDINKSAIQRARGNIEESRRLRGVVSAESRRLLEALHALELVALFEDSGYKGRHLWVFFDAPQDATVVCHFGALFLSTHRLAARELHAEYFPKQVSTGTGIGNLIKLPLGIHRRTGRRSRILRADGTPDPDPLGTLRLIQRVSAEVLFKAIATLKRMTPGAAAEPAAPDEESDVPAPPAPPPPEPAPAWTAAHFERHPEIAHLLRSCPVVAALKQRAENHRRLGHDEQIVLAHSMGHSAAGVQAVNYLFDLCVDVAPAARLQTPLSGNPISCPRIRKRVPHITASVKCHCLFEDASDEYPNPRLHLRCMPAPTPAPTAPAWDAEEAVRTHGVLRQRSATLAREIAGIEERLQKHIEQSGADRIAISSGALVLKHEEGAPPALVWEPAPLEDAAGKVPAAP